MKIQSVDLPGIGKKYTIRSAEGQVFVIIIHLTGRREIYFLNDPDDDEPVVTLDLNDEEARKVGAILLGADYQPVSEDRMELLMKTLLVEWIKVKPGCAV
ncbi:MAG: potassium transporter TrkA, partial [Bacillota bacterium]